MYRTVEAPPRFKEAFDGTNDTAVMTQAAILLILGIQLRGQTDDSEPLNVVLPSDDLREMGVPSLSPTSGRINPQAVRESLARRYGTSVGSPSPAAEDVTLQRDVFADLAVRHLKEPTSSTAIDLMEVGLRHPHELVRVAAAGAYYDRSSEEQRLQAILVQGTSSIELLVRQVAATALAHASPGHRRLTDFESSEGGSAAAAGSGHTAMLIHGTFALEVPIGGNRVEISIPICNKISDRTCITISTDFRGLVDIRISHVRKELKPS
jgi:hypothetical protein